MTTRRDSMLGRFGWTLALGLALLAAGAAPPKKSARVNKQTKQLRLQTKNSARLAKQESTTQTTEATGKTELWLFGVTSAELTQPFDAGGVRVIIDLRTFDTAQATSMLDNCAQRDMGVAICLRWKNPVHEGERALGSENYDVPPTSQESAAALASLEQVLSSEPARRMGRRLYVQIYNEIGGGPGTFGVDDVQPMFAFADAAVSAIRRANPDVRICGPALSGGQLAQYGVKPRTRGKVIKTDLIERWMAWTAANADVADVHLNGQAVDANWADQALTNMRAILDERGGRNVGLVSLEWSCSGYPDRTDQAGVEQYIRDLWTTLNRHNVHVAAYTYWPLFDMPEEVRSRTSWASVMGEDKKPNPVVADTLAEIGNAR